MMQFGHFYWEYDVKILCVGSAGSRLSVCKGWGSCDHRRSSWGAVADSHWLAQGKRFGYSRQGISNSSSTGGGRVVLLGSLGRRWCPLKEGLYGLILSGIMGRR